VRHADAGYETALAAAHRHGIQMPAEAHRHKVP
jgi:urocanate hydratase